MVPAIPMPVVNILLFRIVPSPSTLLLSHTQRASPALQLPQRSFPCSRLRKHGIHSSGDAPSGRLPYGHWRWVYNHRTVGEILPAARSPSHRPHMNNVSPQAFPCHSSHTDGCRQSKGCSQREKDCAGIRMKYLQEDEQLNDILVIPSLVLLHRPRCTQSA